MNALASAWEQCFTTPDPPGLENLRGNNAKELRVVAKLVHILANGQAGATLFLGSVKLAELLGCGQRTALRRLDQLQKRGVIRRTWTGKKCIRDEAGELYAGGALVNRASEYVYLGAVSFCNQK